MPYQLGIDFGTTSTAAAVRRLGRVESVRLGEGTAAIPSLLYAQDDGTWLVGDAADRQDLNPPGRLARDFKRRFGHPEPITLGGRPYSTDALASILLAWVVEMVSAQQGERPDRITLTHPADWGPFKRYLLREAAEQGGLGQVTLLAEPEAAALCYASIEPVHPGTTVALCDLGGGTFDAALLRRSDTGFVLLGQPQSVELPSDRAPVGPTGASCPEPTRPAIEDTVDALRGALVSAGLSPADVDRVVLVGESTDRPPIAELIAAELGRPVVVGPYPTQSVALGAVLAPVPAAPVPAAPAAEMTVAMPLYLRPPADSHLPAGAVAWLAAPDPTRKRNRSLVITSAAFAAVLIVVGIVALARPGSPERTTTGRAAPAVTTPMPSLGTSADGVGSMAEPADPTAGKPPTAGTAPQRTPAAPGVAGFPSQLVGAWAGPADLAGIPILVRMTIPAVARGQSAGPYSVEVPQAACRFTTTMIEYGTDFVTFLSTNGGPRCADGTVVVRLQSPGVAHYRWSGAQGVTANGILRHG